MSAALLSTLAGSAWRASHTMVNKPVLLAAARDVHKKDERELDTFVTHTQPPVLPPRGWSR